MSAIMKAKGGMTALPIFIPESPASAGRKNNKQKRS